MQLVYIYLYCFIDPYVLFRLYINPWALSIHFTRILEGSCISEALMSSLMTTQEAARDFVVV